MATHAFTTRIQWIGNWREGTARYCGYGRTWDTAVPDKAVVHCSNDLLVDGDPGENEPDGIASERARGLSHALESPLRQRAGVVVASHSDSPLGLGEVGHGRAAADGDPAAACGGKVGRGSEGVEAICHRIHEVWFVARW